MSYDSKKVLGIIFIVLLLVVALGAITGKLNLFAIPSCNYEVLSLDKVDFISNAEQFNKPAYRATIVQNNAGECIVGRFSADEVNSKAQSSDLKAQYGFWVELNSIDEKCVYPLAVTNDAIWKLSYGGSKHWTVTWDNLDGWTQSEARQEINNWFTQNGCDSSLSKSLVAVNPFGMVTEMKAWCVKKSFVGYHGDIKDQLYTSETKVTVASNKPGETPLSRTFEFGNNIGGMIGDKVYVHWSGYMMSPYDCPNVEINNNIGAIYVSNKWRTIDNRKWLNYDANKDTYLPACLNSYSYQDMWDYGDNYVSYCVNKYNSQLVNPVLSSNKEISLPYVSSHQEITGNNIYVHFSRPLRYNVFTLTIDADWLGIMHTVGVPKIVSYPQRIKVPSGQVVWYDFKIKDDADYPGTFNIWAECERPLSSGITQTVRFGPKETKTVSLPFSATTDTKESRTCVLHVASELKEVTATFYADLEPKQGLCTPGELSCGTDGYWIQKCSSTGYPENYKYCQNGCITSNGEVQCKGSVCDNKKDGVCPPGCPSDPDCNKNNFDWLFKGDTIMYIVIGIGAILLLSGLYRMHKEGRLGV